MRMLVAVMFLAVSATPAFPATPTHYFHGSTSAVTVPGGTTTTYLNVTAPTGTTVKSISEQVGNNAGLITIGTFRSVAFASASTIDKTATATFHLSANSIMHECAQVSASLYRVSSTGSLTLLGSAQTADNLRIEQGSNQGTVGFTAFTIPIDVTATDRTIAAGAGVEVKLQVASVGCGNRRVFLAYDAFSAPTRIELTAIVDLFGKSATFGTQGLALGTGQSLVRSAIPGWGLDAGQASAFPAVSADGTIFISNMTQTFNEFYPSACTMAVTCFNPDSPTCRSYTSPSTWTAENFSNIFIPTMDGQDVVPSGGCAELQGTCSSGVCTNTSPTPPPCTDPTPIPLPSSCTPATPVPTPTSVPCTNNDQCDRRATAAQVDDLQVVGDAGAGTERVLFTSALGSVQLSSSGFPAFGTLKKMGDGTWDVESTLSPLDLYQSNATLGSAVCPIQGSLCNCDVPCPDGGACTPASFGCASFSACSWGSCSTDANCPTGYGCWFGACGYPTCGAIAEMGSLPRSGHVVAVQYTAASLVVLDTTGAIQAHLPLPTAPNDCAGGNYQVNPREIDVDPSTGPSDPERFVVVFEHVANPHGQVVQEFEYTDDPPTLTAVSAPILPSSGKYPITDCSGTGTTSQVVVAQFDHHGNLWVARSVGLGGGPIGIYLKNPSTGLRKLEDASKCAASGSRPWGFPCATDLDIGTATPGTQPNATWTAPFAVHLVEDPTTGTMFAIGFNGEVTPIEVHDTANGLRFTAREKIGLGLAKFSGASALTTKGIIDDARRALWIPITQNEVVSPPNCGFFECKYAVGVTRDNWLFRIGIDRALAYGGRVTTVAAPATVTANNAFNIDLTVDQPNGISASQSFVSLYLNDAGTPLACNSPNCRFTQLSCGSTSCTYRATVPASMTTGTSGTLAWHATLFASESPLWKLHTTGQLTITP